MKKGINLPQSPQITEKEGNSAVFRIDGCYPGYGITLANALRRVLLSSLPGAAIVAFKIKGVDHEFSTIPYVLEDVIHIGLNLKKISFKADLEQLLEKNESLKATLKVKGEKVVTAKDIRPPAGIEVVNKEAHIATLTHKKAVLEAELFISAGYGYEPSEMRQKEKLPIGTIALDAIYTPIKRVSYEIENMRIGERTDFNRIIMRIITDGSITPEEAFKEAAGILENHFAFLKHLKEIKKKIQKKGVLTPKPKEKKETILEKPIEELKIPSKIVKLLNKNNIKTVKGLTQRKAESLAKIEGLGEKSLKEIVKALKKYQLSLR